MRKSLKRPGFRFKPTDVELAMYYLKKKLLNIKLDPEVIAEININDFSPWDLPAKSILSGDLEWYFFSPKPKKYSSGPRMNRATKTGHWKGTGKDKEVKYKGKTVAMRKNLIFYMGHPPKWTRTNWVMYEYRMKDEDLANQGVCQEAYVVCRVFEKNDIGPKNGAQYGGLFDDDDDDDDEGSSVTSVMMVGVLVNPANASTSGSGPSTITSLENERLKDVRVDGDVMLTRGDLPSILCNNDTQVEDTKGKKVMSDLDDLGQDAFDMFSIDGVGPRVTKETVDPNNAITSLEKERLPDVLVDDYVMLTHGDLSSLLCDTDNAQVEDAQGEKVMSDDGFAIFQELMAKSNPEDLGMCSVGWTVDAFLPDDFLLFPKDD